MSESMSADPYNGAGSVAKDQQGRTWATQIVIEWVGATSGFGYWGSRRVRVQMNSADEAILLQQRVVEAHVLGDKVILDALITSINNWSLDYPPGVCSFCKSEPGEPCRTTRGAAAGAPTGSHRPRMTQERSES